jgi:hypothetical protein
VAYRQNVHIQIAPKTWVGRLLAIAFSAAFLVLAFFFLTFVLVIVGLMVFAGLIRLLLPTRKARGQTADESIEGEYSVESEKPKSIEHPTSVDPRQ